MIRVFQRKFEDYGYILDYMAHGKMVGTRPAFKTEPLVQILGESYFTLLEATPRSDVTISIHERVYIGKELPREKISHISSRVIYNELSSTAKVELPPVVEEIVMKNEERFVRFFNNAQPITHRMHSLELVPGIGKKYTWTILDTREKKPFESFEDIKSRIGLPEPSKLITKRIIEELCEVEPKYKLFTRIP